MDDGVKLSGATRRPRVARVGVQIDPQVEAIVMARHGDPFSYLGMHEENGGLLVRAMLPRAESVAVIDAKSGAVAGEATLAHPDGLFTARLADHTGRFRYRLACPVGSVSHIEFTAEGPLLHALADRTHLSAELRTLRGT